MSDVPKIIFIVPYRNRITHKFFFSKYMTSNLKDKNDYEIYFSHQSDQRPFNRGAAKNIGFLAIKNKYPDNYKDISFVFNDIDTIPFHDILNYETTKGTIKHFYGFNYALGGIVSIQGSDFEKINGFPNYWGWGMEDAILQKRCERYNLNIDRSHFYTIGSPEILHLFDGVSRIINKKETTQSNSDDGINGLTSLYKIKFYIDIKSNNPEDNINCIDNPFILMVNILDFYSCSDAEEGQFYEYDLREPTSQIIKTNRRKSIKELHKNNWTNIPYYPTYQAKQEMIANYGLEKTTQIIEYNLNKNNTKNINTPNINTKNINKYSPQYAYLNGIKPKATISANVKIGL
jgi:hypothetical protein